MLTDRQRVELAIPARLMYGVVRAGQDETTPKALLADLETACGEPLMGLTGRDLGKVVRRIERAYAKVSYRIESLKMTVGHSGATVFYLIETLLTGGTLELYEGSAGGRAAMSFTSLLAPVFSDETHEALCRETAARSLADLQEMGYYR